jgi:hypothetical protein
MSKPKKNMGEISYGISNPSELLEKLLLDADSLEYPYHPHAIFNFFITAYSLSEWVEKYYDSKDRKVKFKVGKPHGWSIPDEAINWITKDALPTGRNYKLHIEDALSICNFSANASKHYNWKDSGAIKAIEKNPAITDWYQFFFTSRLTDLYVDINARKYSLTQIKTIVTQFFTKLIEHYQIEDKKKCDFANAE